MQNAECRTEDECWSAAFSSCIRHSAFCIGSAPSPALPRSTGRGGGDAEILTCDCPAPEPHMKKPVPEKSASALIDARIKELGDWRGKTLAEVRRIVRAVDPDIVEEWKWMGTPVWSHGGIVCT